MINLGESERKYAEIGQMREDRRNLEVGERKYDKFGRRWKKIRET